MAAAERPHPDHGAGRGHHEAEAAELGRGEAHVGQAVATWELRPDILVEELAVKGASKTMQQIYCTRVTIIYC